MCSTVRPRWRWGGHHDHRGGGFAHGEEGVHLSLFLLSSFACNGGALLFRCVCTIRDPRRGRRCKAHRFSACAMRWHRVSIIVPVLGLILARLCSDDAPALRPQHESTQPHARPINQLARIVHPDHMRAGMHTQLIASAGIPTQVQRLFGGPVPGPSAKTLCGHGFGSKCKDLLWIRPGAQV
jgi:hypothetical protein